ncbi:hypothetical protein GDO81_020478 [Engystomops pustulosus]|uniref:Uncharacterized protein n=1 Tax=Engystomops pustulosus TaxID=76066 RepID=A0AAV6YXP1_ENGPU|nr:hypothetical protein GDO81_020478 [Engystomops pustulosus]
MNLCALPVSSFTIVLGEAKTWQPQSTGGIILKGKGAVQGGRTLSRSPSPLQNNEKEKEIPAELAERCLRELLGRAAYGNIKNAIKPVLM